MQKNNINIVILASGRGSNARALYQYINSEENKTHQHSWKLCGILCDKEDAPVLDFAKSESIVGVHVPYQKNKELPLSERRKVFNKRLIKEIKAMPENIDFVICAGFMKVLTPEFLKEFYDDVSDIYRVINIHPSLLPSFPGVSGYKDAYEYGVQLSGVTVHFVDEKIDHGAIIEQRILKREGDDTLNSFSRRGLELEHILYVDVLRNMQNQKYEIKSANNRKYICLK